MAEGNKFIWFCGNTSVRVFDTIEKSYETHQNCLPVFDESKQPEALHSVFRDRGEFIVVLYSLEGLQNFCVIRKGYEAENFTRKELFPNFASINWLETSLNSEYIIAGGISNYGQEKNRAMLSYIQFHPKFA